MRNSLFQVSESATLLEAATLIQANGSRCVLVTRESRVLGTLSEGDILRALIQGGSPRDPVDDFYNREFYFAIQDQRHKAEEAIVRSQLPLIPIVDEGMKIIEVITAHEIMRSLWETRHSD